MLMWFVVGEFVGGHWGVLGRHLVSVVGGDQAVVGADVRSPGDLDAEGLTHAVAQSVHLLRVHADVHGVHSNILRINLQQQHQLLQLPGGAGGELKNISH